MYYVLSKQSAPNAVHIPELNGYVIDVGSAPSGAHTRVYVYGGNLSLANDSISAIEAVQGVEGLNLDSYLQAFRPENLISQAKTAGGLAMATLGGLLGYMVGKK